MFGGTKKKRTNIGNGLNKKKIKHSTEKIKYNLKPYEKIFMKKSSGC